MVAFRCPSDSELTTDSPAVCHATVKLKELARPYLAPHVEHVLEQPYVIEAKKHLEKANADYIQPAYTDYVQPAYTQLNEKYDQYGRPYALRAGEMASVAYDENMKPHVLKAKEQLAPHVKSAQEAIVSVEPQLLAARAKLEEVYAKEIKPRYEVAQPHLEAWIREAMRVMTTVVVPVVRDGGAKVKGLWSDVVQPQVGRIGERLGCSGKE